MKNNEGLKSQEVFDNFINETANGEVRAAKEGINVRRNAKKILKKFGFNVEDEGTELLIMTVVSLYYAYKLVDQDIYYDLDNVDFINPVFDLDNPASPIYDVVVYTNNFDRNYMMHMMEIAKAKSLYPELSYNQIVYPVVSELIKREENKNEEVMSRLLEKYGSKKTARNSRK